MSHEPTALQAVLIELEALGIKNPRNSPIYAVIRWLLAEHTYIRLQESTGSAGIALSNMRRESAHWKEKYEQTQMDALATKEASDAT